MNRDVFQDSQVKKSCPQCMFKPLFELATTCTEKLKKNRPTMIQVRHRALDKSLYMKTIFLVSQPKHILWVLKRTISMRRFF